MVITSDRERYWRKELHLYCLELTGFIVLIKFWFNWDHPPPPPSMLGWICSQHAFNRFVWVCFGVLLIKFIQTKSSPENVNEKEKKMNRLWWIHCLSWQENPRLVQKIGLAIQCGVLEMFRGGFFPLKCSFFFTF